MAQTIKLFKFQVELITMKKFYIPLLGFTLALTAVAAINPKLDLLSSAQLRRAQLSRSGVIKHAPGLNFKDQDRMSYGFIQIKSDKEILDFENAGGLVLGRRGNILLSSFPTERISEISLIPGISRIQLARPVYPKLSRARAASGIDKIHNGVELPAPFTGKGVLTGIIDSGMDPNHINFKDTAGNSRIKQLKYIRPSSDGTKMLVSEYTPEQLSTFKTDDTSTYHGTHTMGIMAGGYKGEIKEGINNSDELSTLKNPFYGAATESDILASCGQLNDMFIAYGIEYMAQYAYNTKQPLVVNLSLGSNLGPHDGKGMMSQYLDLASAQDNILFTISAGNEGDMNIALNKSFTETDTIVQTFIHPTALGAENRHGKYGQIQIYSNDSTVFDTQVVVYNTKRKRVAFRMAIEGTLEGTGHYWVTDEADQQEGDIVAPDLAKYFDGYIGLGCMKDEDTGRFYTLVDYLALNNATYNANNEYLLGIVVNGKNGQRVDFFCDGVYTDMSSEGIEGWTSGSTDGSISDLACTKSALVVGSYNNMDSWVSLDGKTYGYDDRFSKTGSVSDFSSYGTILDGRSLPHLCAPGATIISSTSSPFVFAPDNGILPMHLQGKTGDDKYFWEQMVGTSMSAPLVAGSIALWLEADPTLTPEQIKTIAIESCIRDADVTDDTANKVRWGAGKFDAYAGLKTVLGNKAGIVTPEAADSRMLLTQTGGKRFNAFLAMAESLNISIFDMSGRQVFTLRCPGNEAQIDCSPLASGIYIINVNGQSEKIMIK